MRSLFKFIGNQSEIVNNFNYVKKQINKAERNWKKDNLKRKIRIADRFNIPRDTFGDSIRLNIISDLELYAENYGKIIDYSLGSIRLCNQDMTILIEGEHLMITCYTDDELIIKGRIKSVKYDMRK